MATDNVPDRHATLVIENLEILMKTFGDQVDRDLYNRLIDCINYHSASVPGGFPQLAAWATVAHMLSHMIAEGLLGEPSAEICNFHSALHRFAHVELHNAIEELSKNAVPTHRAPAGTQ